MWKQLRGEHIREITKYRLDIRDVIKAGYLYQINLDIPRQEQIDFKNDVSFIIDNIDMLYTQGYTKLIKSNEELTTNNLSHILLDVYEVIWGYFIKGGIHQNTFNCLWHTVLDVF